MKAEQQVNQLSSRAALLAPVFRIKKSLIVLAAVVLSLALSLDAHGQAFRGQICVGPDTRSAALDQGQAAPQCSSGRTKKGARYVLSDLERKTVYQLDAGKKPRTFLGQYVVVLGALDSATGTIHVTDIFRALPPKVTQAKSVYIDCDNCVRGMAVAWRAAFQELTDWGKFDVTPDPGKADLVFLISANPYLGDYVTRDGPDKRPVYIKTTYMNVVDPHTGASFWGDFKELGSFLVARATKDLIAEFKGELEVEESAGKN